MHICAQRVSAVYSSAKYRVVLGTIQITIRSIGKKYTAF